MEKQNITEEFLYMQKLAGIITEEEYTNQSKELKLKNLSEKISEKVNVIKQHLKDQGYDV
jgi:HJR/Mrr/RecB family endonuclease